MTGQISLRFEKKQATELKRLGYQRHPRGAGWIKPVKRSWFPRYHLHTAIDWQAKSIELDLHLDYEREDVESRTPTSTADSAQVASELRRILQAFEP